MFSFVARITLVAAIMLMILPSCGKRTTTYSGPGGKVEVSRKEDGKSAEVKISTKEGTGTFSSSKEINEKDLGVPIYPNAVKDEGGSYSWSGTGTGGEQGATTVMLATSDSFDDVTKFYKEKLGEKAAVTESSLPQGKSAVLQAEQDGNKIVVSVVRTDSDPRTRISIVKTKKDAAD
ncbi:MAG: hypothetical protein HYU64_00650 [Armatimonadetes bacterium]|nr:hypothetical protein [Armatimonadota bacterium]